MLPIVKTREIGEESFGAVKVKNLFVDRDLKSVSVAMIRVDGVNRRHRNLKSDEFHFVLEGTGSYTVDGQSAEVEIGDLIHVSKDHLYENSGQMTLLVFSSPGYDPNEIEYQDQI